MVDPSEFARGLQVLSPVDIHAVAAALEAWEKTSDDEIEAWQTLVAVDEALRRARCTRAASAAAMRAQYAVQWAARQATDAVADHEVVRVARVAAEIARGLVAGDEVAPHARRHLMAWAALFPPTGLRTAG